MPPLIYIHWRDASYNDDDVAHTELGALADLYEFGWLVKETPEAFVVCSEYQPEATSSRLTLTVPKVNIVVAKKFNAESLLRGGRKLKL